MTFKGGGGRSDPLFPPLYPYLLIMYILFSLPVGVILIDVGGGCALIAGIVALILVRRQRRNSMVSFSQHFSIVARKSAFIVCDQQRRRPDCADPRV